MWGALYPLVPLTVPHTSAFVKRHRRVARTMAESATQGAWYRSWRLTGVHGRTLEVPDTPSNAAAFGALSLALGALDP